MALWGCGALNFTIYSLLSIEMLHYKYGNHWPRSFMKLKCEIVSGRRKTMDEVQLTESLFVHLNGQKVWQLQTMYSTDAIKW